MRSFFSKKEPKAELQAPQVLPRIDQKPIQIYDTKKTLDTKQLVAQTLFGEANFDENEMRAMASVMANRSAKEKADLNSVLAAKDKYGRFEFQGLNNAQAQKYRSGSLGGFNEKEKAAMAARIADELVSGKFKPVNQDRFFVHSDGKLKTYDQEGRTIPGKVSNLDEFAKKEEVLKPFLRDVTPEKGVEQKSKSFFDHIKSAAKSVGDFFARQRQSNRDLQAQQLKMQQTIIASRGRDRTPEEEQIIQAGKEAARKESTDIALGLSVGANTAVNAVGSKIAKEIAVLKESGAIQQILSRIGLKADDGALVVKELVEANTPSKVKGVIDQALTSGELKTVPIMPQAQSIAETNPILQEARKYKTAEEFVRARQGTQYTDSLLSKGVDTVYHQTSPQTGREIVFAGSEYRGLNVATSPELALGQQGKGVTIELDTARLGGRGIRKPGSDFVAGNTGKWPEYELTNAPHNLQKSVKSVTFDNPLTPKGEEAFFGLRNNWTAMKEVLPGGKVKYTNPEYISKSQLTSLWNDAQSLGTTKNNKSLINVGRYDLPQEAKEKIVRTVESIRPELESIKGAPITHEEVLKAAGDSEVLKNATSRAETLKREAQLLKLRQQAAALAEEGGPGVTKEFVESLKVVSNEATSLGRQLESLKNFATPELDTNKTYLIREMLDLGVKVDDIVEAAKGVNFDNAKEANEFFRKFIKPSMGQIIDEYRYINLLSSPRTHIVNAFSNILQTTILRPATKLASGVVDMIGSGLTGKSRDAYVSEVPAYIKGGINSVGGAISGFLKAFRGETQLYRPDVDRIPTGVAALKPFQAIPRLLEASDVFFRTITTAAEKESLLVRAMKQGKQLDDKLMMEINEEATKKGEEYVFRKALDPTNKDGQGNLLSAIDKFTSAVYTLRKVPGVKWFIPFVQTPMNILKMGIEYSPLGVATLPGATNKSEQIARSLVGSTVFAGAGMLALQGNTTWSAPRNDKERAAFYASGRKPYAVKIGDNWVSYSKLGPLAYPMAIASAVAWYTKENPQAATDANEKKLLNVLSGVGQFFADQSYVQGMGDLLETLSGDPVALKRMASNIPSQLIPLVSLQRWVAQIIDPVYRESGKNFSVQSVIQNIKKGIPGLSKTVPAELDPSGKPSKVQNPLIKAFSPLDIGTEVPKYEKQLQLLRRQQRLNAIKKDAKGKRKLRTNF